MFPNESPTLSELEFLKPNPNAGKFLKKFKTSINKASTIANPCLQEWVETKSADEWNEWITKMELALQEGGDLQRTTPTAEECAFKV